ncbi:unnamed protein product [Rhodiola kirilowii]
MIQDPEAEVARHLHFVKELDLHGRVYLNEQGINAQYSGPSKDALAYVNWLREDPKFSNILVQLSPSRNGHAFPKLKLRYKPSLVQLEGGVSHLPLLDPSMRATPLSPSEWRRKLKAVKEKSEKTANQNVVLLDVRNGYEWDIGHFSGAQRPEVDCFRSTSFGMSEAEKRQSDPLAMVDKENTEILMYCTGGIRCDVYSTILRKKGFQNLYTLQGGVSNYLEKEGPVEWIGNLFVFDSRLSLPPSLDKPQSTSTAQEQGPENGKFGRCHICASDVNDLRHRNCANLDCNLLFLCCKYCIINLKGCCCSDCTTASRLRPVLNGHERYKKWHTYRDIQRLPSKFVKRYGAKVSKKVWLEVPTGAKWIVEVKKKKDEIWLRKGWHNFAESLGIKSGHFLVFDYDVMHAVFHVVAIDMSATEIEYPKLNVIDNVDEEEDHQGGPHSSFANKRPKVEEDENEEDSDVVLVNTNDGDVGRKRRNKAQSPFYTSARKKSKPISSRNMQVENIYGNRRPIDQSDAQKVETDQTTIKPGYYGKETLLDSEGRIQCVIQGRNHTSAQTEKAVERARAFRAEEPVCIMALQPSYVCPQKKCHLHFPASFIVAYVNLKIKDVMLRTNDGRTWTVKYYVTESQHMSFLTSGWKKFAIDNDLKAGDVCLFERIKGAENVLKVVVFRVTDEDEAPI